MTDPLAAFGSMPQTLHEKTGRSLEEWQATVRGLGLAKHGEILKALKQDHGLSHGYANMLALLATGYGTPSEDELLTGLFAGSRAGLRPMYDRVESVITGFGRDVEVLPKKSMVGFKRKRQFVCFMPASATRVDLGITLKDDAPADPRIKATPGGMTSHVVPITAADEVDDDVVRWLRMAYDRG
jgi:predicted transport protein